MKILIADDHQLFLDGLSALLREQDYVTDIVSVNSLKGIRKVLDASVQLVITDLRMPGMKGVKHITELMEYQKNTPFIIMSATESQTDIDELMRAGAMAFIPKTTDSQGILDKIQLVIQGQRYHPKLSPLAEHSAISNSDSQIAGYSLMSERQFEVLKALADGNGNQAIADELGISHNTVKTHLRNLFKMFDAKSRVEVVLKARSIGLV